MLVAPWWSVHRGKDKYTAVHVSAIRGNATETEFWKCPQECPSAPMAVRVSNMLDYVSRAYVQPY